MFDMENSGTNLNHTSLILWVIDLINQYFIEELIMSSITSSTTSSPYESVTSADFGDGYSEAYTAAYEEAQGATNEAAITAFQQQAADGIESMKQQTMAKQISNAIKNANLINY